MCENNVIIWSLLAFWFMKVLTISPVFLNSTLVTSFISLNFRIRRKAFSSNACNQNNQSAPCFQFITSSQPVTHLIQTNEIKLFFKRVLQLASSVSPDPSGSDVHASQDREPPTVKAVYLQSAIKAICNARKTLKQDSQQLFL